MLNKFNNKSKAYAAIEHVLDKYPDVVNGVPKLQGASTVFKSKLRNIENYHVPDRSGTMPLTDFKMNLLIEVQVVVEVERSAVVWYARENKLPELESKMPRNQSEMANGTAEERIQRYQSVHKEAKILENSLADFGCDRAAIEEVDTLLPQLRNSLSTTQNAIDNRMAGHDGRTQLYKDMDDFLKNTLDLAVKTRQRLFPAFVEEYLVAKKLPKSPVRSPRIEATAKMQPTPSKEVFSLPSESEAMDIVSFRDEVPSNEVQPIPTNEQLVASNNGVEAGVV